MSELTPCNWCTLQSMIQRDKKVILEATHDGWLVMHESLPVFQEINGQQIEVETKQGEPVGYFKQLTNYCVC